MNVRVENNHGRSMNDSDSNIQASLAHEGCEAHCENCGTCLGPGARPVGPDEYVDVPLVRDECDLAYCEDCAPPHNLGQCRCDTCDEDRTNQ